MDAATVLIEVVLVLWVLAVVAAILRAAWRARGPRLEPITPQAQQRYLHSWDRITRRFMFAPREATQEADSLMVSLLWERGHAIRGDRLPYRIRNARRLLSRASRNGTEALRRAMLYYREQFNHTIGERPPEAAAPDRREMA